MPYRPITLEGVAEKVMKIVITHRLDLKFEVEGGVAVTQKTCRPQTSCVQSVLRIARTLSEAKAKKETQWWQ